MHLADDVSEHAQEVQPQQLAEILVVEPSLGQLHSDFGPVRRLVEVGHAVLIAMPVFGAESRPVPSVERR